MNDLDDYEEDQYDYCYECGGYGMIITWTNTEN